jgi:hypothetical protein
MKLLTIADGYGDSDAVPMWYPKYWKWPEIIKLMTKHVSVKNCSRYGAGNEFIVNQLKNNVDSADVVIIQWAQPNRLDLVLAHPDPKFWKDVIASDQVYNNNVVDCGDNKFWISSGSQTSTIREYHQQYISYKQHQMRSQIFVEYAKMLLDHRNIDYRFMLVDDSKYLNIAANWLCHEPFKGMSDFKSKSKYSNLNLGIVQPTPLVAFDFIKQYIMPSIDLHWRDHKEIDAVENMLYRHYQEALKNRNDSNKKFNS